MKIRKSELFIILMLAFCFLYKINGYQIFYMIRYVISALIIMLFMLARKVLRIDISKPDFVFYKIFCIPFLIELIYSVFIQLIKYHTDKYLPRLISTFLFIIIVYTLAYVLYNCYGRRTLDIVWSAMVVSYLINIINGIISLGIPRFISSLAHVGSNPIRFYLEQHDISFAFGLYFIYFILFEVKSERYHKLKIMITIIMLYLGYKRIAFLAVAIAILVYFIVHKKKFKFRRLSIFITASITIGIMYTYTYFCSHLTDDLVIRLYSLGIDPMGRQHIYNFMNDYYTFGIRFLGRGMGFVTKTLTNAMDSGVTIIKGFTNLAGLHNDILKVYIEIGHIGWFIWWIYWLITIPNYIYKRYGNRCLTAFYTFTGYAILTYATDNTLYYYNFQLVYLLMIMFIASTGEKATIKYEIAE